MPATVVTIGALFGPAQVAARICEFAVRAQRSIRSIVARFAVGMLLAGVRAARARRDLGRGRSGFRGHVRDGNGLITIARGAVPLALFGAAGYGHLMGRIAGPFLLMQAIAPLVLAFVAERISDAGGAGGRRRLCAGGVRVLRCRQKWPAS